MGNKESKVQNVSPSVSSNTNKHEATIETEAEQSTEPITCAELEEIFNSLAGSEQKVVSIATVADCFSKYALNKSGERFVRRYSSDKENITIDEFKEAFSNYYSCNRSSFSRERSLSLEAFDELSKPPPELTKRPHHSKLSPNDRIATPLGPDTGENIPAVCSDCRQVYNYARGHECPALPSFI